MPPALVLSRYLAAFGPATRRDAAAWAGVAQRDFAEAWARLPTVSYRDERGVELLDLPGLPLPPASTPLPVRLLAQWDQPLLAHAERERILPPELLPLRLTLSGDPTVTVEGRVAASWQLRREGDAVELSVTPHVELRRSARPRSAPRRSARRASASPVRAASTSPASSVRRRTDTHPSVLRHGAPATPARGCVDGAQRPHRR